MQYVSIQKHVYTYFFLSLVGVNTIFAKQVDAGFLGTLFASSPAGAGSDNSSRTGMQVLVTVTQKTQTASPKALYNISSHTASQTVAAQAAHVHALVPLQQADIAKLSQKTAAQWYQAFKTVQAKQAMHMYALCVLPGYRAALKNLIPSSIFKENVREIFKEMWNDQEFDNVLDALGNGVRDFYYNEGLQAYAEYETARVEQAFSPSELSQKVEQCHASLTVAQQQQRDIDTRLKALEMLGLPRSDFLCLAAICVTYLKIS